VIPIQVWTNNCRASLDVIVFHGVSAAQLRTARALRLDESGWAAFTGRRDAAVVGRNVAQRRNLRVGSQFSIGEISVQVAGVFESPVPAEENLIYTHLDFLQYTRGLDAAGLVTQHEVQLADDTDPDAVARLIDEALRAGPVATTTRRKGVFQASTLADLVDLVGFAHWLGYACVALVLSLVATTTVMSVQDRIREHAVLQTLGLRPTRVFGLIVSESALLCFAGGVFGTLAAMTFLAFGGMAIGAEGVTIAFRPSLLLGLSGASVSLLVGIVAGVMPALQAARAPIVAALREA
jgi:putative ABC transport system permease protein